MKSNEILRIIAGILCFIVFILLILQIIFDFPGAVVFYNFFVDIQKSVNILEGILVGIFSAFNAILGVLISVIVYINFGIMLIAGRKVRFIAIGANIAAGISIILTIRTLIIYSLIMEFQILILILLILYITIFVICLLTYIKERRQTQDNKPI
ncbi:MAG: hypothetical protein GF317_00855 [Candidatus Lokiarchaeota archaeon]|nr:hypothetical protein [Candidatus Lokiarchaeota archaeon]MBD3198510.1 hypothetical protein [Candidatus Lokiarchaeota archaeon]